MDRSALHYAALDNEIERVDELIRQGSDINRADVNGFTPLHIAGQQYSVEAARLLLEAGATVDAENVYGNTPLFVATFNSNGRGELIALLLEKGADPLHSNKSAQTPLGLAQLIANYDVAQFFAGDRQ